MAWAFVLTHPIQYFTPLLEALARVDGNRFEVLYCSAELETSHAEAGFGIEYKWDIPLLEGYPYRVLRNRAAKPSTMRFWGLDNPELKSVIASRKYQAVILNGWHFKSAWQAIFACRSNRIPVLVRSDSHLRTPRSPLKQAAKWAPYRSFIPRFDACLPAGAWSQEYFLHYGARPDRIFRVPHCVDNRRFEQQARALGQEREVLRRRWGLPSSAVVYLLAGKLIPIKRPLDFLQALERSMAAGAPVAGLVAGDGPLRAQCEEYVRSHQLPVGFGGFLNQSRMAEAYAAADALVLPSESETWGLIVNEAMASGLPCFVSDHVGCGPDLVEESVTGGCFRMGDIQGLAEVMTRHADSGLLASMGRNAWVKIQSCSAEACAKSLLAAVETVVGRGQ